MVTNLFPRFRFHAIWAILSVCLLPACGRLATAPFSETLPLVDSPPAGSEASPGGDGRPEGPSSSVVARAMTEADRSVLGRSTAAGEDGRRRSIWIRVVPPATHSDETVLQAPEARWRYPDLDELLNRPEDRRPPFHEALSDADPIVTTNAAIALARLNDASGAAKLYEAAETPKLPLPMRCAAVEALGSLSGEEPKRLLDDLLDRYGEPPTRDSRRVYIPELHAELVAALGRHRKPPEDPRLLAALRSSSSEVRLEALRVWAGDEAAPLPDALIDLRMAGDFRLRIGVVEALAMRKHPDANRLLGEALRDHDLRVRVAAVKALGGLGDADAEAMLEELLGHHSVRLREAAVAALAALGAQEAVLKAVGDESWRVRAEVARALADFRSPEAAVAAETLLDDPSTEVHRELLTALAGWPVEQSGPVLLRAMAKESFLCRKTAHDQLAAAWPPAVSFPAEAPADRRRPVLQRLTEAFRDEFGVAEVPPVEPATDAHQPALAPEELQHVEQLLAEGDAKALVAFGPRVIRALEVLAFERHRPIPEDVYHTVLPELQPEFALLARLETDEVLERRRAASELDALTETSPLGRLAVERLCRLVTPEPDSLVFQSALSAVAGDGSEAACRLAYAAVGHPAAEVRRRGCMHLAAHPDPKHAPVLLPVVEDESHSVVAAAVQALGACGQLPDASGLDELLRSGNESLRFEVAAALVQLDDPRGVAALERLAYSRDAAVRRGVAETMGELGDPAFTPTLIRLLDDRVSVMRAALAALPEVVGEDVAATPGGAPATTTERVRRWKAWFAAPKATVESRS